MQYEEFDKKIRDAADHHHPAYDEQAWAKMESLLDQHLPREKEKKRRFFFFWLFFLLVGGTALFIAKPWSRYAGSKQDPAKETIANSSDTKTEKEIQADGNKPAEQGTVSTINSNTVPQQTTLPQEETTKPAIPAGQAKNNQYKTTTPRGAISIEKTGSRKTNPVVGTKDNNDPAAATNNNADNTTTIVVAKDKKIDRTEEAKPLTNTITTGEKTEGPVTATDTKTVTPVTGPVAEKTEVAQKNNDKKEKPKSSRSNAFFLSVSAGPDISAAGGERSGKAKLLAGLGLGYTFRDRLTVRTGFYSGRKIYAASPDAYNPPADFWNYYPYLEKVEADCKVYEIPLAVSYNFGRSAKQNWFVSAGLSSYLMKKEVYDYYYKYIPGGPTLNSKWTVNGENNHFFSIATLSGGYQRNINSSVSLLVEPYIKIPLSGVGYGKVKLNSGGVLMTLSIKPFQKSNRQN